MTGSYGAPPSENERAITIISVKLHLYCPGKHNVKIFNLFRNSTVFHFPNELFSEVFTTKQLRGFKYLLA